MRRLIGRRLVGRFPTPQGRTHEQPVPFNREHVHVLPRVDQHAGTFAMKPLAFDQHQAPGIKKRQRLARPADQRGQMLLLALVFFVVTIVVFSAIALLAGRIGGLLTRSPRAQVLMNRVAGTIFLGLAAKLALSER